MIPEKARHGIGMTDVRQGAGDDDPIKAGKHAGDIVLVSLDEGVHQQSLLCGFVLRMRETIDEFWFRLCRVVGLQQLNMLVDLCFGKSVIIGQLMFRHAGPLLQRYRWAMSKDSS